MNRAGASLANTLLPMLCSWQAGADIPPAFRGPVAQLGARLNGIEEVGGSNPPRSTSFPSYRDRIRGVMLRFPANSLRGQVK